LLGLRYEAFTQAVVLPQGEFARFLHSQPRDRRDILRDLLRLQVFERMRKQAFEAAKQRHHHLQAIEQRLEQDYKDATEDKLRDLGLQYEQLGTDNEKKAAQLSLDQENLERMKFLHAKTQELQRHVKEQVKLNAKEPSIEEAETKLETARRVVPMIPLFEAVDEAGRRVTAERERLESANTTFEEAAKALEKVQLNLETARQNAAVVPDLRERLRALDEIKGLLEPREAARKRLLETNDKLGELDKERGDTTERLSKARTELKRLEAQKSAASSLLQDLAYDQELDRLLDERRDEAVQLGTLRREASGILEELDKTKKQVEIIDTEVSRCQAASVEARRRYEDERHKADAAQEALQDAERDYSAAHIREHLKVGAKCPVCGSCVKKLPPPNQITFVEALKLQAVDAKRAEEAARKALEDKDRLTAKALSERETVGRAAGELEEKAAVATTNVNHLETSLAAQMKEALGELPDTPIEDQILSRSKQSSKLRIQYASAVEAEQAVAAELKEAAARVDQLESELEAQGNRVRELERQSKSSEDELHVYDEKISRITEAPDPVAEAEQLHLEVQKLEKALRATEQVERSQSAEAASKQRAFEEASRVCSEVAARARQKKGRLSDALKEAGFESEAIARRMVVTEDERSRLEREVSEFRRERHATQKRIEELEKEIGTERISDEDLSRAMERVSRLQDEHEEGLEKRAALGQQLETLADKLKKADALNRERNLLSEDHAIYRRLADDLRSENFQAYLLEEAFRELVQGASERLRKLSGRYAMDYCDDEFYVLDHDNAGERRSADTLSGGETFLASLALALELSEQVQRAAGAVHLDSLFIDEGFGTLDHETLDTVTAAIESLPVGGRMVGIITHIPELTERLPECIRVEKTIDGSRVVQERV
jgi:exonuclease SbcC